MRTLHSILLLIFAITTSAHAQHRGIIDEQTVDEQVQAASAELIGTWQGLLGDTGLRILLRFERTAGGAVRVLLGSPDEETRTSIKTLPVWPAAMEESSTRGRASTPRTA